MREVLIPLESAKQNDRAASFVRVALERTRNLIGFIAIFGAALGGYAALGLWAIAVSAIALTSLSYAEFSGLYRRAEEIGMSTLSYSVALRSFGNALAVTGVAYIAGLLFRFI